MAYDSTLTVRRAGLAHLKGDTDVTTLVIASSIYPQSPPSEPAWPFIRWGAPAITPIRAACVDGGETTVAVHAFAKPKRTGETVTLSAEDHAHMIGAAVASSLDRQSLALPSGSARFLWTGSQILADPAEADAYHAIANFRVRVIA